MSSIARLARNASGLSAAWLPRQWPPGPGFPQAGWYGFRALSPDCETATISVSGSSQRSRECTNSEVSTANVVWPRAFRAARQADQDIKRRSHSRQYDASDRAIHKCRARTLSSFETSSCASVAASARGWSRRIPQRVLALDDRIRVRAQLYPTCSKRMVPKPAAAPDPPASAPRDAQRNHYPVGGNQPAILPDNLAHAIHEQVRAFHHAAAQHNGLGSKRGNEVQTEPQIIGLAVYGAACPFVGAFCPCANFAGH